MLNKGFTILELMIALTISLVVLGGLMGLFASQTSYSEKLLTEGRLDREMHLVMDVIASDIKRAGFWASASTSISNPFMDAGTDLQISASNDCVLLSYDSNQDSAIPTVNTSPDDERYGYRRAGNVIQYRPYNASFDCAAATDQWENLNDEDVWKVTYFNVTFNQTPIDIDGLDTGTANIVLRSVTVNLTGQLTSNPAVTLTLSQTIKPANDKYEN